VKDGSAEAGRRTAASIGPTSPTWVGACCGLGQVGSPLADSSTVRGRGAGSSSLMGGMNEGETDVWVAVARLVVRWEAGRVVSADARRWANTSWPASGLRIARGVIGVRYHEGVVVGGCGVSRMRR